MPWVFVCFEAEGQNVKIQETNYMFGVYISWMYATVDLFRVYVSWLSATVGLFEGLKRWVCLGVCNGGSVWGLKR